MSDLLKRLNESLARGEAEPALLAEAAAGISELRARADALEELLIMLVRTGWPWDEDGEPNDIYRNCRDGYAAAMVEARKLLGLDHRSVITRTEPRT